MKELIKPYAPFAKALLVFVSLALVSYGVYDAQTLELLIGSLTGIATAFWTAYDQATKPKE